MKMTKYRMKTSFKRFLSAVMVAVLGIGLFTATDIYYDYSPHSVYAAELVGMDSSVAAPAWNIANIPERDTSGEVTYYYAGNGFNVLNQLNDGVKQSGAGTSGHLQIYNDSSGPRLVETTYNSAKAVKGNASGCSDFTTYSQRTDIDFSKTWELMDTDAVWDDQYLFAQYQIRSFDYTTSAFAPDILNTVNGWYNDGFSYDGSKNSRPTIAASGESWFSEAEKAAVKSAEVKTDGNEGSTNTTTGDTISEAKLFAPSIDEMYYNPVQVERVISNLAADKSDVYNATSWQCARSDLWSRSFWGVHSSGHRLGFLVGSSGQVHRNYVAHEFAVAPAFYLDLEKIEMARSAQAGNEVTANAALAAYNPDSISGDVKFLVQDDAFAPSFTSSINGKRTCNVVAGNTYSINYSGATTSTVNEIGTDENGKLCISAAIYDGDGKVVYYGPLSDVTRESGAVDITIPSGLKKDTTYTLALFEEQLGGTSTYETSKNSNNGNTFTQTNGGKYVNYETDYMSGSVAYMSLAVSDEEFDVTVNDDAVLYAGSTYSARDIDELVSATAGGNSLTTGEYYVMTKDVYDEVGDAYANVTTSPQVNKVITAENPGNEKTSIDLIFVYYASRNGAAQVVQRTLDVEADRIENSVDFDSNTWYQSLENNITWNYKLNGNGDIIGLYTEDSIVPIVDGGGALNIPSKVAGRTVVAVGGGTETTPVIPASESSWTSVSFPSTVTTLNDYAFYNTKAMASIVIPSTVEKIGMKAFYASSITGVKINEMDGSIGSLAFGAAYSLTNVTLKGGTGGLTVSTIAFRDSGAQSVTVKGKVNINKNAFKNNTRLSNINISGNVKLGEYAFTGCTAVDSLVISGKVDIGSYAFNNLTCLAQVYLPAGTTVKEYAFNGCTALTKVEADVDLVNHSFEGCNQINTLILDENVSKVAYDWEGHGGSYSSRKIYVKNKNTDFEFYGNDGTYISPFGSAGSIIVYVLNDATVDQGTDVSPSDNVMTLKGYTCYAHKGNYNDYITGSASSVTLYRVNSIETQMDGDGIPGMEITSSDVQTGIEAYYTGVILTTRDINKDNMTVIPVYGSDEGDRAYKSEAFYIIRTTEFNALEGANNVTESEVSSYEPVHANAEDLDAGQETGTISVTVIVFYENESGEAKYFSTPVTIRVEEYNAKSFVEQEYGSYENIAQELATLTDKVKELEAQIETLKNDKEVDAETITQLQKELTTYKEAYEKLLDAFSDYTSSNKADDSGYFGTTTGSEGETVKVVYIEGNATAYEKTEATSSDGKTVYTADYDTDGDGIEEKIYFFVDADGVHLTDVSGNPTGTVYTDTLGAIERQTAAQLLEVKKTLASCESGLSSIIEALKEAGYDIDISIDIDEQYKEIVNSINDMADKIKELENSLSAANTSVSSYESALESIYALLTGSTLEADDISGISNTLKAITSKIQNLQNNLQVAQATVTDLQNQLDQAENDKSALESELETTKTQLSQAKEALNKAQTEKDDLVAQYEKALADGDEAAALEIQKQIAEKQAVIEQLETTQEALSQKEKDIIDAQDRIASLQKQIDAKNQEIEDLKKQLEALSSSADGFAMTVDTANDLFGLTLGAESTDEEVYNAIVAYVQEKLSTDQTIAAIQALVNSNNTGSALVRDVESAIKEGGQENPGNKTDDNYIDDSVVNSSSNNYKSGYNEGYNKGYAAGIAVNSGSGSTSSGSGDEAVITNLKSQISSLTSTNSRLQDKIDKLEDKVDDLEDDKSDLKSSNSTLSNKVSDLNTQVVSLTSKNNDLSGQITTLTGKNNDLSGQVSTLTTSNSELTGKVDTLTAKNESLSGEITNLKSSNVKSSVATKPSGTAVSEQAPENTSDTENDKKEEKPQTTAKEVDAVAVTPVPELSVSGTLTETDKDNESKMKELQLPSPADAAVIFEGQRGTGAILKLTNGNALISSVTTNGGSVSDVSEESLNNAYRILEYYSNHLQELGNLGSEDVLNAAEDKSKAVLLETIVSADIKPSTAQEAAISNGVTAKVELSFDGLADGNLYLIIHESEAREGCYDVSLTEAANGMLEFSVPDLSPVTVAKVSVDDVSKLDLLEDQSVETMEDQNDAKAHSSLRIVVYIMILVAILVAVGVLVYIKIGRSALIKKEENDA